MSEHPEENNELEDQNDETLYEHHKFIAEKGQNPLRVDKYLMNYIEKATRNKIQKAAKDGNIYVNDVPVKQNYKVKAGDVVQVMFEHPPYEFLLTPENIPLDIVYEDDTLLVVNKPAGMVVHPGHGNYSGTLINALVYHFENLPNNSSDRPGLVHRIDKDTSGLLVIAKTEHAMAHYRRLIDEVKMVNGNFISLWHNDSLNDQKRIMTPSNAIEAGADYLVIGRPITQSNDPKAAAERIAEEISIGHSSKYGN